MDVREINAFHRGEMSTIEFGEVAMKAGEEGKEDDVTLATNSTEEPQRSEPKKMTKLQSKRLLLKTASQMADNLSNADLARIAAALLHK